MTNINETIVYSAIKHLPRDEADFNALKRETARAYSNTPLPNKTELLKSYHKLLSSHKIKKSVQLEKMLIKRAIRTLSGVAIITSLTRPHPCPGQCIYCPLDERMPKSYLSDEPAAARALALKFDPYEQMARRIEALERNGHPTDKIELIVKGGTWNSYPLPFQYWFILESFRAANKAGTGQLTELSPILKIKTELLKQQKINEKAKHRIVGLTLETRPDFINEKTIWEMRSMGCTRVELGVQNTDDKILQLIKRGHTAERTKQATRLLKNYGFKVDFHLMPQLPGSTPKKDLAMLKEIFVDEDYRPDMIKIYPCTVVKNSELYDWFKGGKYKAYPLKKLLEVLKRFKTTVPRYVRISRLIRDIPGPHIENGNRITNLRQVIQEEMKKDGLKCNCLRCREVGHQREFKVEGSKLKVRLFVDKYKASGGKEYFLSFEDAGRNVVFGFCRLRINGVILSNAKDPSCSRKGILRSAQNDNRIASQYPAFIRELHTYGQLIKIGKTEKGSSQHQGLGKKLIIEAEKIARREGADKLAVISGVGVRDYYHKLGYRLEKTYMVRKLS